MIKRTLLFLVLLGIAMGIPYLKVGHSVSRGVDRFTQFAENGPPQLPEDLTGGGMWDRVTGFFGRLLPGRGGTDDGGLTTGGDGAVATVSGGSPGLNSAPLEGEPVYDLAAVLRFDVTPNWVYNHWRRKSTALGDINLHGVRVPLVTGTGVGDLSGALTYYFDRYSRVEQIAFHGQTGDTRRLIDLVTQRFGLQFQTPRVAGEQLYEARWNGQPLSQLRIRPASVMWAHAPHSSFDVDLVLNRPGAGRYVPPPQPGLESSAGSATAAGAGHPSPSVRLPR